VTRQDKRNDKIEYKSIFAPVQHALQDLYKSSIFAPVPHALQDLYKSSVFAPTPLTFQHIVGHNDLHRPKPQKRVHRDLCDDRLVNFTVTIIIIEKGVVSYPTDLPIADYRLPNQYTPNSNEDHKKIIKHSNDWLPHSPDFRSIYFTNNDISFSSKQAEIFQCLYENYENGTPDVGQDYLLDLICSDSDAEKSFKYKKNTRIRDYFRDDEVKHLWGTLILKGKRRGTLRLCGPKSSDS